MLALNTYGLAIASRSGTASTKKQTTDRAMLPRLCSGGGLPAAREIRSLTKVECLTRPSGHPFYRSTSAYDYGHYLDFEDVALSCPKYNRPAGFTKEFIAGNFADNSLLSLDNRKRRAEHWQEKMAARSAQMRRKYAERQHILEKKMEVRRVDREKRRLEMAILRTAVVQLQARMRGYLTRYSLALKKMQRKTEAVLCIQRASRARARVRTAKQVVEARRQEKQEGYAIKIQRSYLNFLLRQRATQQLMKLQEAKRQKALEVEYKAKCQRNFAAKRIQRLAREHLARKALHRHAIKASSMEAGKINKELLHSVNGRSRSRGASRVVAQMQQARRKQTKAIIRPQSK